MRAAGAFFVLLCLHMILVLLLLLCCCWAVLLLGWAGLCGAVECWAVFCCAVLYCACCAVSSKLCEREALIWYHGCVNPTSTLALPRV